MDKTELKYLFFVSTLLALSFPPFPLGICVPFALAFFLWFLRDKPVQDCFRLGYWLGLIWGTMTLYWIAVSMPEAAILVIPLNAFHYAIIFWLYGVFRTKSEILALFILPFIWTGMEYLRYFSDIRFNWMILAHTQSYYLTFIQFIEWTGYLAISFLLVFFAVSLYSIQRFRRKERWILPVFSALLILTLIIYGTFRVRQIDRQEYRLIDTALIQPNVDPYLKWDMGFKERAFEMLMSKSREIVKQNPDLIIWPETATPFHLRNHPDMLSSIAEFTSTNHVYLLTGTPDYGYSSDSSAGYTFNAAFLFSPGQPELEKYYKIALVPGSETIPFKTLLPSLRKFDLGGGDFFPGKDFTVFRLRIPERIGHFNGLEYRTSGKIKNDTLEIGFSAVICYESVFPHLVRRFIDSGANLLAIITNDGWFGVTSGPFQHARFAVFRAIENRVSIIRCTNTGISCFIDPTGRILQKKGLNIPAKMNARLPIILEKSYYTRSGEWFGKTVLLISVIFIFFILLWKLFFRT